VEETERGEGQFQTLFLQLIFLLAIFRILALCLDDKLKQFQTATG